MPAMVEVETLAVSDQSQVGFVDRSSRLQGPPWVLLGDPLTRQMTYSSYIRGSNWAAAS